MFMTPLIFVIFTFIGSLMGDSSSDKNADVTDVYVNDQLELFEPIEDTAETYELAWDLHETTLDKAAIEEELEESEDTAYIFITEEDINQGEIPVYTSDDMSINFMDQVQLLEGPITEWRAKKVGLTDEELAAVSMPVSFDELSVQDLNASSNKEEADNQMVEELLAQIVPGAFGGIILLSIVITGMYIFQSASLEKKDKIAEIILSSVTPGELMQGKIVGYFILGIFQTITILLFAIPIALWKVDYPVITYLLVPETLLFVFIAILGYLLFASLFVGIGATMADMSSAGNFQGLVMMLPFLPFIFIGPVISDPSGLFAKIGTFFPFTTPGVLILRLSLLEEWPWLEIGIALLILIVTIWIAMKMAGKVFKVGILMYGKNATPKEIWKWLRT